MILDAYRVLSGKKIAKSTKEGIYKNGFFFGSGIFSGILLNDLWRNLSLPGSEQKLVVSKLDNPEVKDTKMDEVIQYGIVTATMILSLLTGKYVKEVLPMAAGAYTGIYWSNYSERGGHPISILPF